MRPPGDTTRYSQSPPLFGFLGAAPVFFGSILPSWVPLPLGVATAIWFFSVVSLPFCFRRDRASDLVAAREGIEVCGGRFSGRRLTWPQLAEPESIRLVQGGKPPSWTLLLPEGIQVKSEEPDEGASLTALAESLQVLAHGYLESRAEAGPAPLDPRVLGCAGCGAPLPIVDAEESCCPFCAGATPALGLRA